MNQVYYALFERSEQQWHCVSDAMVCNPEDVPIPTGGDWLGVGNGFSAYADALNARLAEQLTAIQAELYPHAAQILALALPQFAAGLGRPAHEADLVYLRDKVALKTHERVAK